MADASTTTSAAAAPPASLNAAAPKPPLRDRLLPFIGPVVLFIVWDLVVRLGFIKPILLPTPADTIAALITGWRAGRCSPTSR
jgi:sulfonate transport system permease protein